MQDSQQGMDTPIFIGGLMKSGTSLLRKLISNHPNIFGGLETHWFSNEFTETWKNKNAKRQQWLSAFFEVSEEEINSIREASETPFQFIESFLNYCTRKEGKKRWVEKTPDNIFHTELIWTHWPNAKIISLNRDLKDIFASWKKHKNKSIEEFSPIAEKFFNQVQLCLAKPNFLLVNYEDLILDTQATLKSVCNFLEEPFIEKLEHYEGDKTDYQKVLSVTGKTSPTTVSLAKPIFNSSIGQWKTLLSSKEVEIINKLDQIKV